MHPRPAGVHPSRHHATRSDRVAALTAELEALNPRKLAADGGRTGVARVGLAIELKSLWRRCAGMPKRG